MNENDPSQAGALRKLPQVEKLADSLGTDRPHSQRVIAAQAIVAQARRAILAGEKAQDLDSMIESAERLLSEQSNRMLVEVINATGVLLHTNLGRAPLGASSTEAIARLASVYNNLEYDLVARARGSRYEHAADLLTALTEAEAALVVNNNAAAVMLALSGLAKGSEVIISRGELIEIGGEFRIPDILKESGARLVEVGTTNRTHLRDYERALTDKTGAIMKVHPSNYRVVGFASSVNSSALVQVAKDAGVWFIHDIGSGLIRNRIAGMEPKWLKDEPNVLKSVQEGADVVTFSGDKLLGGPQAGIIVGRAEPIEKLRRLPLLRAVRTDKTTLAALEATLIEYLNNNEASLPFWKMALTDTEEIWRRAHRVADSLDPSTVKFEIVDGSSTTGGGAGPGSEIPTALIKIAPLRKRTEEVFGCLIDGSPPLVSRIENDMIVIDLRTVDPEADGALTRSLNSCV